MKSNNRYRRRLFGAVLVAGGAALLIVATAAAVPIRGSVQVPRDSRPPQRAEDLPDPFYWEEWNGVLDPRSQRLDAQRQLSVVLLGDTDAPRPESAVKLRGGAFMPSTMVVQAGSTLRIENTDGCAHELFSETLEGFGPLQTAPGNARTASLPQEPGHHVIRDRLYPHVVGHVHVVANLVARAQLADDGKYEFDDVAPGHTYTVKVFFEDREVHSQEVEVTQGISLDPVSLNLSAASQ